MRGMIKMVKMIEIDSVNLGLFSILTNYKSELIRKQLENTTFVYLNLTIYLNLLGFKMLEE